MQEIPLGSLISLFGQITHSDELLLTYNQLCEKPFIKETAFKEQHKTASHLIYDLTNKLRTYLKGYSTLGRSLNYGDAQKLVWTILLVPASNRIGTVSLELFAEGYRNIFLGLLDEVDIRTNKKIERYKELTSSLKSEYLDLLLKSVLFLNSQLISPITKPKDQELIRIVNLYADLSDDPALARRFLIAVVAFFNQKAIESIKPYLGFESLNKRGDPSYHADEIDVDEFEKEYKGQFKIVNDVMQKNGMDVNDLSSITDEQLKDMFNLLISIKELEKLIDGHQSLPKTALNTANRQTRLSNKRVLAKMFPRTLKISQKKIEEDKLRLEKWLEGFLPHWDIYEMPSTLMRQAFIDNDLSGEDIEDLLPADLWEFIKHFTLIVKKDEVSSLERKLSDFKIFELATSHLQSVWSCFPQKTAKLDESDGGMLKLDVDELFYKESYSNSIDDKKIKSLVCSKVISETDKKSILRQMYIEENISYRNQNEGVLKLLFSLDYCRSITIDSLCMFVGYLAKLATKPRLLKTMLDITKQECAIIIKAFIESLLTGANTKKILGYEDVDELTGGIRPAGIFMQYECGGSSKKQLDLVQTQRYYDVLREAIKSFSDAYPDFAFQLTPVYYTGRSYLVEEGEVSPCDIIHITGSRQYLARSSIHYVQPYRIVERLTDANKRLLTELIDFIDSGGLIGRFKYENKLIKLSRPFWDETLQDIGTIEKERMDKYEAQKPRIIYIGDDELMLMQKRLKDYALCVLDGQPEYTIVGENSGFFTAQLLLIYGLYLFLMLRPGEPGNLYVDCLCFNSETLIINSKKNKEYDNEVRVLHTSAKILEMLRTYFSEFRKDIRYCYLKELKKQKQKNIKNTKEDKKHQADGEKLFPHAKEVQKVLRKMLEETNINLDLNSFRRRGGTYLHKYFYGEGNHNLGKKLHCIQGIPFEIWTAIMGHTFRGFEPLGINSDMDFGIIRRCMDAYADSMQIDAIMDSLRGLCGKKSKNKQTRRRNK